MSETDRIERKIVIQAPREKVWQALANAEQFGTWFGAKLQDQAFEPGKRVRGQITTCGFEHIYFDVVVDRMEPPTLFSYRWHPFPVDPNENYTLEEPTLVTFTLAEMEDKATLLTVVESGFDKVPPHRRLEAFRMNDKGWAAQLNCIAKYVTNQ